MASEAVFWAVPGSDPPTWTRLSCTERDMVKGGRGIQEEKTYLGLSIILDSFKNLVGKHEDGCPVHDVKFRGAALVARHAASFVE